MKKIQQKGMMIGGAAEMLSTKPISKEEQKAKDIAELLDESKMITAYDNHRNN